MTSSRVPNSITQAIRDLDSPDNEIARQKLVLWTRRVLTPAIRKKLGRLESQISADEVLEFCFFVFFGRKDYDSIQSRVQLASEIGKLADARVSFGVQRNTDDILEANRFKDEIVPNQIAPIKESASDNEESKFFEDSGNWKLAFDDLGVEHFWQVVSISVELHELLDDVSKELLKRLIQGKDTFSELAFGLDETNPNTIRRKLKAINEIVMSMNKERMENM